MSQSAVTNCLYCGMLYSHCRCMQSEPKPTLNELAQILSDIELALHAASKEKYDIPYDTALIVRIAWERLNQHPEVE